MGVSENVVSTPLYPMVLLIMIPFLNGYFIGNIPYSDKSIYLKAGTAWHLMAPGQHCETFAGEENWFCFYVLWVVPTLLAFVPYSLPSSLFSDALPLLQTGLYGYLCDTSLTVP